MIQCGGGTEEVLTLERYREEIQSRETGTNSYWYAVTVSRPVNFTAVKREKQEKYFKGKGNICTAQSLMLNQYPVDLLKCLRCGTFKYQRNLVYLKEMKILFTLTHYFINLFYISGLLPVLRIVKCIFCCFKTKFSDY